MLGIFMLVIALSTQIGFLVFQMVTKKRQSKVKNIIRIGAFICFTLLLFLEFYWWGFRWIGLFITLTIMAVLGVMFFIKEPKVEEEFNGFKTVLSCMLGCILLTVVILPGIIFPQFKAIKGTGKYEVTTISSTYIDETRMETFTEAGEDRKISVQFWYPVIEENADHFPLVVFSHGSFGFRGSNQSTFEELASNGYVVCSIDHTYHAFYAQHMDGSNTIVNMEFLNNAVNIENDMYDEQTTFNLTKDWLKLRTADMNFVLDEIFKNINKNSVEPVYSIIDTDNIGLFGHSLGGATAAQLGRERMDVDSIIVIDGTMLGERLDYRDGKMVLIEDAYPLPLLNLYNDSHYQEAKRVGMEYDNIHASSNGIEAYDVVIRDSGHLNFTDLPLFSPVLGRMLGVGEVDSRYCVETMNNIILNFFNYTLKEGNELQIKKEY